MRKLKLEELGRLSVEEFKAAPKAKLHVILDNIRSLNNVGSVFRSSDAFRVEKIWLCGYTPRPPHREITKTAIGAENSVQWEYRSDILPLIDDLKSQGAHILSVEQAENSTHLQNFSCQPDQTYAIVLGNEVEGVSQEVVNRSDVCLEIPQFGTKHSLNISVATGIVLYSLSVEKGLLTL